MAASNVNVVVVTGNLIPVIRSCGAPPGGTSVCKLRGLRRFNSRRKDGQSGEWVDKPNFFDVTVWGAQGENCANYLSKGRPVAVEGRLDWREWEAQDGSGKRQSVEIYRQLGPVPRLTRRRCGNGNGNGGLHPRQRRRGGHLGLRGRRGRCRRRRGRRHPVLGKLSAAWFSVARPCRGDFAVATCDKVARDKRDDIDAAAGAEDAGAHAAAQVHEGQR